MYQPYNEPISPDRIRSPVRQGQVRSPVRPESAPHHRYHRAIPMDAGFMADFANEFCEHPSGPSSGRRRIASDAEPYSSPRDLLSSREIQLEGFEHGRAYSVESSQFAMLRQDLLQGFRGDIIEMGQALVGTIKKELRKSTDSLGQEVRTGVDRLKSDVVLLLESRGTTGTQECHRNFERFHRSGSVCFLSPCSIAETCFMGACRHFWIRGSRGHTLVYAWKDRRGYLRLWWLRPHGPGQ